MLNKRLKILRTERRLTQDEVSKAMGITKAAYGYYESGRNMPSVDILLKLSKYFGVTTDFLLGQSDYRDGRGSYRQAALSPLGDVSKLSQDDLDEINAIIELKLKRNRKLSNKKDS